MVIRKKVEQIVDKTEEKKLYFSSQYALNKVCNLEIGQEIYCIPLNLEAGVYEVPRHRVETRSKDRGFKGKYGTWIKCKGYDDFGERVEGAVCCELAKEQITKFPEKEDYFKRLIKPTSRAVYIPVMILGYVGMDKGVKRFPVTKLMINNYKFSYLDLSESAYNKSLITPFIEKLKKDGAVDYDLEGEELRAEVAKYLRQTIIKISIVAPSSSIVKYEKNYDFTLFSDQRIGQESGQYKHITNYKKISKVNNDITDFITLFDSEVDNICTNWTDDELIKYINVDGARSQKIEEAVAEAPKTVVPKEEQVVTMKEEIEDEDDLSSFDDDLSEPETFGAPKATPVKAEPVMDEPIDDDFDLPEEPEAKSAVALDESLMELDLDEEFVDEE